MSAILSTIFSLLSGIPGIVGDYFKKKQELEDKKLDAQLAIELENKKLAAEYARAQFELQKTIVRSTSPYFKYFTFVMWFGPYMLGVWNKSWGQQIFENMAGMPEWYIQSCVAIMFTIWGIQVSAPVVANIFNGLQDFFRERRTYKLQKLDRKAYYDTIRKLNGGKPLPQQFVDQQEAVFNEMEGK